MQHRGLGLFGDESLQLVCQCILLLVFPASDGQSPVVQRGPARNIVEGQEILWICLTPMDLLLQKHCCLERTLGRVLYLFL